MDIMDEKYIKSLAATKEILHWEIFQFKYHTHPRKIQLNGNT